MKKYETNGINNNQAGATERTIEQQISMIRERFPKVRVAENDNYILKIPLHERVEVEINLKKFPKCPKINIDKRLKKIIGNPSEILSSVSNWKKRSSNVVDILEEFKNFISFHGGGKIRVSMDLMGGFAKLAQQYHPKTINALLSQEEWVISNFYLVNLNKQSDKTSLNSIFDPLVHLSPNEVVGTIHSHPSGDTGPSPRDILLFSKYMVNFIIAAPYSILNMKCYDKFGHSIEFELI